MSKESVRVAFRYGDWKPTRHQWMSAGACIQPEEQIRVARFVYKKDAKAAMTGRLMIRKAISDSLGLPYTDIQLSRTPKGKPYLTHSTSHLAPDFNFNMSHQGDYTIVAAEPDRLVGIDTMKVQWPSQRSVDQFFTTMRRQLTDQEWMIIESGSTDWERIKLFYRHWCLKESFIKALGVGIGYSLKRLEFHLESLQLSDDIVDTSTTVFIDGFHSPQWSFEERTIDGDHIVAVALRESDRSPDCDSNEALVLDYVPIYTQPSTRPPPRIARPFKVVSWEELMSSCQPIGDVDETFWTKFHGKPETSQTPSEPAVLPD